MFVSQNRSLGQLDAGSLEAAVLPAAGAIPVYVIGGVLALTLALWWGKAAKKTVKRVKVGLRKRRTRSLRKQALKAELARL